MDFVRENAKYYGIEDQREGETDADYRRRVAGALRGMGHLIEAHEVSSGKRYEESDDVLTAIMGAVAQDDSGLGPDYGRTGDRRIGDDIALGNVLQNPRPQMSPEMIMLMVEMFGK